MSRAKTAGRKEPYTVVSFNLSGVLHAFAVHQPLAVGPDTTTSQRRSP